MPIDLRTAPVGSPEWYLVTLLARLQSRVPRLQRYDDYYNGSQPLAFASDKFKEAFGSRFPVFSSNFMALVVDATRERIAVQGFRFKDPEGDKDLWGIWQENDLDAGSDLAHTEALVKGMAYTIIEPNPNGVPRITVEDPLDCVVQIDRRDRRKRTAALKRWIDDDGRMIVYVYLPEAIYKYRSDAPWTEDATAAVLAGLAPSMMDNSWAPISALKFSAFQPDGENWPLNNPLGVVPVVCLPNRPRIKHEGQSEIALVLSNQDAINKYRADALIAAEFAAFRQRWAIGIDIPIDPDSGQPIEPFKAAVDHLWIAPPADPNDPSPERVQFGEFEQTDLAPYKLMIELEVDHISHVTRLPLHQLLGQTQSIPASGEAIKSAETGLVKKIETIETFLGDGWEETMRVALLAMNDPRAEIRTAETIWKDAETRNDAVITDATVKLWQAGIIDGAHAEALAILGFSPAQAERIVKAHDAFVADNERKAAEIAAQSAPPPPTPITRTFTRDAQGNPVVNRSVA